ncbi:MAG TPA: prepilin-type N-terminal cleavage/methylation domain-containing protein, partial [Pseudohaliea sp.]|nr:prepilin-type N-terminal cleavage/methylation domain-containing protein [Pseudohaliea sp.]
MRLSGPAVACRGFALAEVLVALLLFSLAIAGGLRAQLGALTGTRDTLWQARAGRLLQDLAQRDGAGQLLALAPATLPLAGPPAALNLPPAIGEWVAVALAPQARPPGAALCLTP